MIDLSSKVRFSTASQLMRACVQPLVSSLVGSTNLSFLIPHMSGENIATRRPCDMRHAICDKVAKVSRGGLVAGVPALWQLNPFPRLLLKSFVVRQVLLTPGTLRRRTG
jgi:hypothetical protein